jgi:cytosine/adenosine deaminase-related metal-dependent hydrolase
VRAASALNAMDDWLDAGGRYVRQFAADGLPPVYFGISPHAPYTVSPDLLRAIISQAHERSLPVAMHLAESADELELLAQGTGRMQELLEERSMWDAGAILRGSRPLDYLRILAGAPRASVIHGNYLDAKEWEFLAAHSDRMTLIHCPRTHSFFGHPPLPLDELLAAGAHIALGTDSRASNPNLDVLAEMRQVARLHPTLAPDTILRMGTLAGAIALGLEQTTGSITSGKAADLVAVPLPEQVGGRPEELLTAILAGDGRPCQVWLRGGLGLA